MSNVRRIIESDQIFSGSITEQVTGSVQYVPAITGSLNIGNDGFVRFETDSGKDWKMVVVSSIILEQSSSGLVLRDQFNRPDSNTVGNGWVEQEIGVPTEIRILNNAISQRGPSATWFFQTLPTHPTDFIVQTNREVGAQNSQDVLYTRASTFSTGSGAAQNFYRLDTRLNVTNEFRIFRGKFPLATPIIGSADVPQANGEFWQSRLVIAATGSDLRLKAYSTELASLTQLTATPVKRIDIIELSASIPPFGNQIAMGEVGSTSINKDEFFLCGRNVIVNNMPTGFKARVNSFATESIAVESASVAIVDIDGLPLPWESLDILDASNEFVVSIFPVSASLPNGFGGDVYNLVSGSTLIVTKVTGSQPIDVAIFDWDTLDLKLSGSLIPIEGGKGSIGTFKKPFKDAFLSSGSLFIGGKKALSIDETLGILVLGDEGEDILLAHSASGVAIIPSASIDLISGSYVVTGSVTASSFFGENVGEVSFIGSASFAPNTDSASVSVFAETASFAETTAAGTASFVESASFADQAIVAQQSSQSISSSFADNSILAQQATQSISASLAETASIAETASFIESASFADNSILAQQTTQSISASFAATASKALAAPLLIPIPTFLDQVKLNNIKEAVVEIGSLGTSQVKFNLKAHPFSRLGVTVTEGITGSNPRLGFQFSPDGNDPWTFLDGAQGPYVDISGSTTEPVRVTGPVVTHISESKGTVFLRVVSFSGSLSAPFPSPTVFALFSFLQTIEEGL